MEKTKKNNNSTGKYNKRCLFNSRTFNSKLFLKLVGHFIDPSIICIQTLRYEQENRKFYEIEKTLPWLKDIPHLNYFMNLKETPESSHKLLIELAWVLFYKYYKKNTILKKAAENEEFFYILLNGEIVKLSIVFEKETLTLDDYMIYLMKLKYFNEKLIIQKCRLLNSFYVDIDGYNIQKFCDINKQFNYEKLKEIAKSEILNLGFKMEDLQNEKVKISSLQNYLKITSVTKRNNNFAEGNKATPCLYLGKYIIAGYIKRGQAIGNLTKELFIDNSTYLCSDNCDIAYINKKKSNLNSLYKLITEKKKRLLSEIKDEIYVLKHISDNTYYNEIVPHFEYKRFFKGEKIFIQGTMYEGIYLIKEGKVDIYLNSSPSEIANYISNIKNSLCGFKEYISILNLDNNNKFKEDELINPKILNDQQFFTKEKNLLLNEKKKYEILSISKPSILGTNELFDYNTGIYYFSAECISEEASIYFLPKNYFYRLLIREKPIYLSFADTVELKVKYIIGKLKSHIRFFELIISKKNKRLSQNKLKLQSLTNNDIHINNKYKSLKDFKRPNMTIHNYNEIKKKDELPFEFPPLIKEKNDKKRSNIYTKTLSSFSYKDNIHKLMKDKEYYDRCKKINLKLHQHPKTMSLFIKNRNDFISNNNKKGKSFKNSINTTKKYSILTLPTNFPFKIQNSYYN